jgi:hypothetical protein
MLFYVPPSPVPGIWTRGEGSRGGVGRGGWGRKGGMEAAEMGGQMSGTWLAGA